MVIWDHGSTIGLTPQLEASAPAFWGSSGFRRMGDHSWVQFLHQKDNASPCVLVYAVPKDRACGGGTICPVPAVSQWGEAE
jgi:hypothetical protein